MSVFFHGSLCNRIWLALWWINMCHSSVKTLDRDGRGVKALTGQRLFLSNWIMSKGLKRPVSVLSSDEVSKLQLTLNLCRRRRCETRWQRYKWEKVLFCVRPFRKRLHVRQTSFTHKGNFSFVSLFVAKCFHLSLCNCWQGTSDDKVVKVLISLAWLFSIIKL